jgi:hypothetical protein
LRFLLTLSTGHLTNDHSLFWRTIDERQPAKIEMVTLKQLCVELKVDPREARERLRLAVRDAKKNPELVKSHKSGHAWEWPKNSPAVKEARAALRVEV